MTPERIALLRDFATMLDMDGTGGGHIREMLDALEAAQAQLAAMKNQEAAKKRPHVHRKVKV